MKFSRQILGFNFLEVLFLWIFQNYIDEIVSVVSHQRECFVYSIMLQIGVELNNIIVLLVLLFPNDSEVIDVVILLSFD